MTADERRPPASDPEALRGLGEGLVRHLQALRDRYLAEQRAAAAAERDEEAAA